ncbi:MAG: PIN domain-containing protein [Candidatus Omnitrophica bacterium]|nr:PIN domain-containing protein [Candidatus Omnitrophota bacterium]
MAEVSGVLVDTSVWVSFFRSAHTAEGRHMDGILQARVVRTCAPVRAELLSGARTERERAQLRELFQAIPLLDAPADLWDRVEEARFVLARKGHPASLIDLMIAYTASAHQAALWTLDDDFSAIRHALSFPRYLPELD